MNKQNRKQLEKAVALIAQAQEIVETIKDEEQEKFDNLPESLQQSEKGEQFEENISALEDALGDLESATENINTTAE